MKVYKSNDKITGMKTSVALGTFDGLHIAHMNLINRAAEYARENEISSGVMTFDTIPANTFGKKITPYLMTAEEKINFLDNVDFFYIESFDGEFYGKSTDEFVDYIQNVLNAEHVCVGYNYRFGKGASGDAQHLKNLCAERGITVEIVPQTNIDGECVSSTKIREMLSLGNTIGAKKLLGRRFSLSGQILSGYQNGRKMGLPTANVEYDPLRAIPKPGVYSGCCEIDGQKYTSVINVGDNPTFNGKKITIEAHILDFSGDIYGKTAQVEFESRIRDEIKFSSPTELTAQIKKDIDFCRKDMLKNG